MKKLIVTFSTALVTAAIGTFAQTPSSSQGSHSMPAPVQLEDMTNSSEFSQNVKEKMERVKRDFEKRAQQFNAGLGAGRGGSGFGSGGFLGKRFGFSQNQDAPIIVCTSVPEAQMQAQLNEDLTVMRHLLEKSIDDNANSEARRYMAMGIDVFMPSSGPSVRSLYLQGHGALFVFNVNYPLVAPSKPVDTPKPASGSSEWEKAKREVYGQPEEVNDASQGEVFDAAKVARLQDRIINALKNGSNIRSLKSGESITVCINGGSNAGANSHQFGSASKSVRDGEEDKQVQISNVAVSNGTALGRRRIPQPPLPGLVNNIAVPNHTTLVISVSKTDLDALSSGKIKPEEFQKKVIVTSYSDDPQPEGNTASAMQMKRGF